MQSMIEQFADEKLQAARKSEKPGFGKSNFLKRTIAALVIAGGIMGQASAADQNPPQLDQLIASAGRATAAYLSGPEQRQFTAMFANAMTNVNSQLVMAADGTAYIQTGDIPAEWLRDSSRQMVPLLFLAREDKNSANKVKAVIQRQAEYISLDPYANAFRDNFTVWERKYELDSLLYPMLLVWTYWKVTGDNSVFTPVVQTAFARALDVMLIEQDHDGVRPGDKKSAYQFPYKHKSLLHPVGYTGMIYTAFTPADDQCTYNFLIPVEIQAVQALTALAEMEDFMGHGGIAVKARTLRDQVHAGIEKYGVVATPDHGKIYAYEVDGLGNAVLMDDANFPNLLSIPYFGYSALDDKLYQATRKFVLSPANPYFYQAMFEGQRIAALSSPHGDTYMHSPDGSWKIRVPPKHMVWPLGEVMQGLTAETKAEQVDVLKELLKSDPGDRMLHEMYLPQNPQYYARANFGWVEAEAAGFWLTSVFGLKPLPVPPPPLPAAAGKAVLASSASP